MGAGRCGNIVQSAKWAQEDVETLYSLLNKLINKNFRSVRWSFNILKPTGYLMYRQA
jgi:hypothetical protein